MLRFAGVSIFLLAVGCGGDRTSELVLQLKNEDVQIRRAALMELGKLGPDAATAVTEIAVAATDEDREVRRMACHALGEIGSEADSAIPALTETLKDGELSVRLSAAFAIQKSIQRIMPMSRNF